jgi:hypothetical protein
VANRRLQLELDAALAEDASNPRVQRLEAEVRRLRHSLAATRAECDRLREGVETALARGASAAGRRQSGERRRGR